MCREPINLAVLFADVCKSTHLFETYGDARARELIADALARLSQVAGAHDGRVVKTIGDEIMCTFPTAESAVRSACAMQALLAQPGPNTAPNVKIRIGLQFGTVLQEDGDVYGDAVNVAARMAGLARAGQIITTKESVEHVPDDACILARSLGQVPVRGKQKPMEICEVIWQPDTSQLTVAPGTRLPFENLRTAGLRLTFRDREIELGEDRRALSLGRGEHNDLVVDEAVVSRSHATIERRLDKFVLVDQSTNGTFVKIDNEPEIFVHREELHLHGHGVISLGQEIASNTASRIRYQVRR